QGTHAGGLAAADGHHVRPHELHGVINGHSGSDRAAGRVDVKLDILFRVFSFQKQELSNDQVGNGVVNGRANEDDVVAQQPGVDVISALAAARLLHNHGYKCHMRSSFHS